MTEMLEIRELLVTSNHQVNCKELKSQLVMLFLFSLQQFLERLPVLYNITEATTRLFCLVIALLV